MMPKFKFSRVNIKAYKLTDAYENSVSLLNAFMFMMVTFQSWYKILSRKDLSIYSLFEMFFCSFVLFF